MCVKIRNILEAGMFEGILDDFVNGIVEHEASLLFSSSFLHQKMFPHHH
jgi:hypothetical protein